MKIVMINLLDRIIQIRLLKKVTIALVIYSCIMLVWAFDAGIHLDAELLGDQKFEGYLGKFNWSLYPLWWLFLAILVHLSWTPFLVAWRDVHARGMLLGRDGKPASAEQLTALCRQMSRFRVGLVAIAVVLSSGITFFDTAHLREIYDTCSKDDVDFANLRSQANSENSDRSCEEVTSSVLRELNQACGLDGLGLDHNLSDRKNGESSNPKCEAVKRGLSGELEIDFNIAYLVHGQTEGENELKEIEKEDNRRFNRATYFQQIVVGALAALAFLQLALLCNLFWRLENATWINRDGLKLVLDPYSKLYEYGLESWNHALNNVYWVFSLALLVPLASRHAQSGEGLDFGQLVLQLVVPGMIAMPMLATIIARQQRQRDLWPQILAEENPDKVDLYHRQLLWPLDRNWASKLGIVLSFVLLSYLVGRNLLSLAG